LKNAPLQGLSIGSPARMELRNDVVSGLAADDMRPIGPRADARGRTATLDVELRRIGEIAPMALAGVDQCQAGRVAA